MPDDSKGPVVIRGIPLAAGEKPQLRLEIRDLQQNHPDQWNLYLLGLESFQNVGEDKHLSYFQIAGIHGIPFQKWPDGTWNNMDEVSSAGFCTHSSILFLNWHKPYLSLYETELHKHVTAVAHSFSESEGRSRYAEAAKTFRMPYWDWARPFENESENVVPMACLQETKLQVIRPGLGGKSQTLDPNPLVQYKFQNNETMYRVEQAPTSDTTVRYPAPTFTNKDDSLESHMLDFYNRQIKKGGEVISRNLTERVAYVMQSYQQFGPVSNNAFSPGNPGAYGSLEDIHGAIHNIVGTGGHMNYIDMSSFDPIFWLHHCNIDRLLAIWEGLHGSDDDPRTFVTKNKNLSPNGTFTTASGAYEDEDTDLTPFWDSETTFWTAKKTRHESFGYAYPETQEWNFASKDSYRSWLSKRLKQQYGIGSLATVASNPETFSNLLKTRAIVNLAAANVDAPANAATFAQLKSQIVATEPKAEATIQVLTDDGKTKEATVKVPKLPADRKLTDLTEGKKYLEWLTNIRARKHSLEGKYTVHIFIGPVEESLPHLWEQSPNHVGTFSALGQTSGTHCEKCKKDQEDNLQITSQIPLTIALAERYLGGQLNSLEPDDVVPYLKTNLHWRVALVDGHEMNRPEVDDLVVSVISNECTVPEDPNALPVYADDVKIWESITTRANGTSPRGEGTGLTDQAQA